MFIKRKPVLRKLDSSRFQEMLSVVQLWHHTVHELRPPSEQRNHNSFFYFELNSSKKAEQIKFKMHIFFLKRNVWISPEVKQDKNGLGD